MRTEFSKLFNELEEEDFASIQGEKLLDEFLVRFDTVEKRKQFLE